MAIHSPNTRLLGSGFETNCFDYDLDHKFADFNIRSDCITSCIKKKLSCSNDELVLLPNLLRIEYFQNRAKIMTKLCSYLEKDKFTSGLFKRYESQCKLECRKDCKFTYFLSNFE